jgi:hypothetical protein
MSESSEESSGYHSSASDDGHGVGVGLCDPHHSHGRRQMLDLVNKLHSTGFDHGLYYCAPKISSNASTVYSSTWTFRSLRSSVIKVLER